MHTKKLKFLLVFFIALMAGFTLTSCSSDDEEEEFVVESQNIVGSWLQYSNNDQELIELVFKADRTCNYSYSFMPDDDRYDTEYEFATGIYKINGNKLTMTLQFDDKTEIWEFTIVSVNSSKLVLKNEDGEKITFESLYE